MKVYKFGDSEVYYDLVIEEDNGEIRVANVSKDFIREYIATEVICKDGYIRLSYGTGSSMPYKNADGTINQRFKEIEYEKKESV